MAEVLAPSLAQGGHLSPPGLHLWFQRFIFHCQITRHTLVSMMSLLCFLERKSSHDQICSGIFICYLAITQNTKPQNKEIGDNLKAQPHLPSVLLKKPLNIFTFINETEKQINEEQYSLKASRSGSILFIRFKHY